MQTLSALFIGLGSIGTRHLKNLHTICARRGIRLEADALRSDLSRPLRPGVEDEPQQQVQAYEEAGYQLTEYMEDKIGQAFTGKIISVQAFGFFVELPNTVEGLVPLHSLMDDFYDYDETASCLKGEATKKTYQLGQKVDVICVGADKLKGQVSFVCKEE